MAEQSSEAKSQAAQLKEEGNTHFVKKEFREALQKYSQAIKLDDTNAVLYCNRSACSLALRKYSDAASDAKKATELDSAYPKAWARRAAAHAAVGEDSLSVQFWERAIQALPNETPSPAEIKQREQYEAELSENKQRLSRQARSTPSSGSGSNRKTSRPFVVKKKGDAPFHRAEALEAVMKQMGPRAVNSSVWTIVGAYREFQLGVEYMKGLRQIPASGGRTTTIGHVNGLTTLTNGIMRDSRAFHIDDPRFIEWYNKQVIFEAQQSGAWVEGDPELIIREAQVRLREKGWDDLRPALATTIRAYIMRGFMENTAQGNYSAGVQFMSWALEVIEWGAEHWKDVPYEDRGVIFRDTFIRGLRNLFMEAYLKACSSDEEKYPIKKLYDQAEKVIKGLENNTPSSEEMDPSFFSSFYMYPLGHAHAMVGYYHAKLGSRTSGDAKEEHYNLAGQAYLQAADHFPIDDEYHPFYLHSAVNNLFQCGVPVNIILPIMERIRKAIPDMKKVWEYSALAAQGRDSMFKATAQQEQELKAGLREGRYTMDMRLNPPEVTRV